MSGKNNFIFFKTIQKQKDPKNLRYFNIGKIVPQITDDAVFKTRLKCLKLGPVSEIL